MSRLLDSALHGKITAALKPRLLAFLLLAPALWGQNVSLGLKVGVPLTDYFQTGTLGSRTGVALYHSDTRRYVFGLSAELPAKHGLGLEVDAFYHRMGFQADFNSADAAGNFSRTHIDVAGNSWDFPIMLKHRFGHTVQPYVAGGFVLRWISSASETGSAITGTPAVSTNHDIGTNDISEFRKTLYPGVTVVGGVDIPARGKLHLSPEFRYTHWTANIAEKGGLIRFDPNQAEVNLGFIF